MPSDEEIASEIRVGELDTEGVYSLKDGRLILKKLPEDPLIFCGKGNCFEDAVYLAQLMCADPDLDNWIMLCPKHKAEILELRQLGLSGYIAH